MNIFIEDARAASEFENDDWAEKYPFPRPFMSWRRLLGKFWEFFC